MSKVKVLGISGSPRGADGYSDKLMRQLLAHVLEFSGEPELLRLAEKKMLVCEGCYSKTRSGRKCTFPCIHDGQDDTSEVLNKIIQADAIAISSPIYWAAVSASVKSLVEKMTAIENNARKITRKIGREPLLGKPFVLLSSQETEGASLALSQMAWTLNHMGMMLLPQGLIFKPNIIDSHLVRAGLTIVGLLRYRWVDYAVRLAARNLVLVAGKTKSLPFDDYALRRF